MPRARLMPNTGAGRIAYQGADPLAEVAVARFGLTASIVGRRA
jgi:hypothetical protein